MDKRAFKKFKKLYRILADENELARGVRVADNDSDIDNFSDIDDEFAISVVSIGGQRKHDIKIYIVDGEYVRDNLNSEFTNYGQHYRFPFIPTNEIWLDKEYGRSEKEALIAHAIKERALMKGGVDYKEAYWDSKDEEEAKRKSDNGGVKLKRLYMTSSGISIWLVDGKSVRSKFTVDFTQGGHGMIYGFIPKNEIWIDNAISAKERDAVILHEVNEMGLMKDGMPYHPAHRRSSLKEIKYRKMKHGFIPGKQLNTGVVTVK